jgi:hypothetical protein
MMSEPTQPDEQKFIDFVMKLVNIVPPGYVRVESTERGSHDKSLFTVEVRFDLPYCGMQWFAYSCTSLPEADLLAVRVRRAIDAVSKFGMEEQ